MSLDSIFQHFIKQLPEGSPYIIEIAVDYLVLVVHITLNKSYEIDSLMPFRLEKDANQVLGGRDDLEHSVLSICKEKKCIIGIF